MPADSPRYALHGYFRSSCSWRVRIALELKGLPWESVPVHLLRDGGQQNVDAHRALNPMAQVPVLVVDSAVALSQSLAILEYLEERHPEPALLPEDPFDRARVRAMAEIVNSGIQPLQNLSVFGRLKEAHQVDQAGRDAWGRHFIQKGLGALEAMVPDADAECCVGSEPTFADVCLVPQLYNARRFQVDLSPFPRLTRIESSLLKRGAFWRTRPEAQPDAEA